MPIGYAVYVRGTQALNNLRASGYQWADVTGTYASPAALGAGEKFGYTYHDSSSGTTVSNPASATFAKLTNGTTNAVVGSAAAQTGTGCVTFDAQSASTTAAASYAATIIYTAVPTF